MFSVSIWVPNNWHRIKIGPRRRGCLVTCFVSLLIRKRDNKSVASIWPDLSYNCKHSCHEINTVIYPPFPSISYSGNEKTVEFTYGISIHVYLSPSFRGPYPCCTFANGNRHNEAAPLDWLTCDFQLIFSSSGVDVTKPFFPFRYFHSFTEIPNTEYLLNITFIFGRCRR